MGPADRDGLVTPQVTSPQDLQRGVLTALMHIVAVRDAGVRPLAIEFSAALDAVNRALEHDSTLPAELKQCFDQRLTLQLFKVIAQQHVEGVRRLPGFEPERLRDMSAVYRKQYLSLVIAAAKAALDARIDESLYRRRATRWQRSALEDIEKAVQPYL